MTAEFDIQACVTATAEAFGGISTLINNVGWGGVNPDPLAVTEQQMIDSYRLNTISAYRMSCACAPYLFKAKNATITNSGPFSSAVPAYDILAYGTAKAALNQLMVSMAHALAAKVRVNSILIGTVITEGYASAGIDEATQKRMMSPDTLTGRPGRPDLAVSQPRGHHGNQALIASLQGRPTSPVECPLPAASGQSLAVPISSAMRAPRSPIGLPWPLVVSLVV